MSKQRVVEVLNTNFKNYRENGRSLTRRAKKELDLGRFPHYSTEDGFVVDCRVHLKCEGKLEELNIYTPSGYEGQQLMECFTDGWYLVKTLSGAQEIFPKTSYGYDPKVGYRDDTIILDFDSNDQLKQFQIKKDVFNTGDLPLRDFAELVMNTYGIPELQGKAMNLAFYNLYESYSYRSPNGWEISIGELSLSVKRVTGVSDVVLD